ncbi:MAG: zinc dependent phospholipase C family protein [Treponema sp.]|jgi:hypothetical protein|nr:zinc dependent phospholipase C family protein [Treponema sp.]
MPSQILHTLFGEDVVAGIYRRIAPRFGIVADKALEKISLTHKKAFALGCQGPDIFYHSQESRPVGLEYGALLHRRGAGIFTAGLLKMGLPDPPPDEEDIRTGRREKGINALGAYALGFMTHAVLDRAAHPYIVYKSGWVSPRKPETLRYAKSHAFFERVLDVLMLERLRGEAVSGWNQEEILASVCENPPLGLKELLAKALVLAFPERAGKDEKLSRRIENTFADCRRFYRLTDPRRTSLSADGPGNEENQISAGFLAYVFPEKLSPAVDFLNLEKKPWYYPAGKTGTADLRSFPELYEEALRSASESITPVITEYLAAGIFPIKEAARAIGNGGLSIVDEDGKPCAPTRSDPLPLDQVLEDQARLRDPAGY